MTVIKGSKLITLENGLRIKLTKMAKPTIYAQYLFEVLEKSIALGKDVVIARGRVALQPRVWIKANRIPNPSNKNAHKDKDYIDDPSFPMELLTYGKDTLNSQIQDGITKTLGAGIICQNDIEIEEPKVEEPENVDEEPAEEPAEDLTQKPESEAATGGTE